MNLENFSPKIMSTPRRPKKGILKKSRILNDSGFVDVSTLINVLLNI